MVLLPEWTEKAEKRGLDPLGIQNSGVVLYQSLLPGISNVTLRMRYYGYYCWVSEAYARDGASSDFEAWRNWVRKAEALYALVSALASEGGVGGIEWANRRLAAEEKVIDFARAASTDPAQERYLRQSLGVFGGAYYTQMAEMGLFTENKHGIQVATRDLGRRAATLFGEAIGPVIAKLLYEKISSARVSLEELESLEVIAPSEIDANGAERAFYEDLLLAKGMGVPTSAVSRATSLKLILETARAVEGWPSPEDVRWHLFHRADNPFPDELEAQRLNWEAYQCQDLMQVASAALLAWAISIMNATDGGISIPDLHAEVSTTLAVLGEHILRESWSKFRTNATLKDYDFQHAWDAITSRRGSAQEKAIHAIHLMAALHQRIESRTELAAAIDRGFPKRGPAHSVGTELDWLSERDEEAVESVMADYVIERTVLRHSWVAMQKLRRQRDYTFLFEVRDGRLVYLAGYQPVATTPRLAPAIQFLADVHLIDDAGPTARALNALGVAA